MKTYNNYTSLEIGSVWILVSRRIRVPNLTGWMKTRLSEMEPLAHSFKSAHRTANSTTCPKFNPIWK